MLEIKPPSQPKYGRTPKMDKNKDNIAAPPNLHVKHTPKTATLKSKENKERKST